MERSRSGLLEDLFGESRAYCGKRKEGFIGNLHEEEEEEGFDFGHGVSSSNESYEGIINPFY